MFGITSLKEKTFSFVNSASRSIMSQLDSNKVEALKQENDELRARLADQKNEINMLKQRLHQLEGFAITGSTNPHSELETIIEQQSSTIDQLRQQIVHLQQQKQPQQISHVSGLEQRIDFLEEQLQKETMARKKADAQLPRLQQNLMFAEMSLSELKSQSATLRAMQLKCGQLQLSIEKYIKELNQQKIFIVDLKNDYKVVKQKNTHLQETLRLRLDENKAVNATNDSFKLQIKDLVEHQKVTQNELSVSKQKIIFLQGQNKHLLTQISATKQMNQIRKQTTGCQVYIQTSYELESCSLQAQSETKEVQIQTQACGQQIPDSDQDNMLRQNNLLKKQLQGLKLSRRSQVSLSGIDDRLEALGQITIHNKSTSSMVNQSLQNILQHLDQSQQQQSTTAKVRKMQDVITMLRQQNARIQKEAQSYRAFYQTNRHLKQEIIQIRDRLLKEREKIVVAVQAKRNLGQLKAEILILQQQSERKTAQLEVLKKQYQKVNFQREQNNFNYLRIKQINYQLNNKIKQLQQENIKERAASKQCQDMCDKLIQKVGAKSDQRVFDNRQNQKLKHELQQEQIKNDELSGNYQQFKADYEITQQQFLRHLEWTKSFSSSFQYSSLQTDSKDHQSHTRFSQLFSIFKDIKNNYLHVIKQLKTDKLTLHQQLNKLLQLKQHWQQKALPQQVNSQSQTQQLAQSAQVQTRQQLKSVQVQTIYRTQTKYSQALQQKPQTKVAHLQTDAQGNICTAQGQAQTQQALYNKPTLQGHTQTDQINLEGDLLKKQLQDITKKAQLQSNISKAKEQECQKLMEEVNRLEQYRATARQQIRQQKVEHRAIADKLQCALQQQKQIKKLYDQLKMSFSFMLQQRDKLTLKASEYNKLEEEKRIMADQLKSVRGRLQQMITQNQKLFKERQENLRTTEKTKKELCDLRGQLKSQQSILSGYHNQKMSEAGKVEQLFLELQDKAEYIVNLEQSLRKTQEFAQREKKKFQQEKQLMIQSPSKPKIKQHLQKKAQLNLVRQILLKLANSDSSDIRQQMMQTLTKVLQCNSEEANQLLMVREKKETEGVKERLYQYLLQQ